MFNSMRPAIESVNTATEMKMKSRWSSKKESEGSNLTKSSDNSLKRLPTPLHHRWVLLIAMSSRY